VKEIKLVSILQYYGTKEIAILCHGFAPQESKTMLLQWKNKNEEA